ncbi:hypothetical protein BDZ89DRAFT_1075730 [Hymenopellis radicata]|nr:hypothetical protein BDZ89DRAFT_1075730 [Hymenopellis radicata]
MFVPFLSERKIGKTFKHYKRKLKSKFYQRPTSPQDRGIILRRTAGGGTRAQVGSGTSPIYGSGYPDVSGRGTAGRNFPFYYMPLVYESPDLDYLNPPEYGGSQSSNRPGGPMKYATITGLKQKQTLRVVSDASTVTSLITDIRIGCGNKFTMSVAPNGIKGPFNYDPKVVRPESTIQYFRASSISLELDGYNNSAAFAEKDGAANTPFPVMDAILTGCVIKTINQAAPLVVTNGVERWEHPNAGIVLLLIISYHYLSTIF